MLDGQSGDRQARAEALMLLLLAVGEHPHRLVHGRDRDAWHLAALPLEGALAEDAALAGRAVRIGRARYLVLALTPDCVPGEIPAMLRDPATGQWTASIALDPFVPPAAAPDK